MFEVIQESGEDASQFGEDSLVLKRVAWKALLEQPEIIRWKHPEKVLQVSAMAEALILDQYRNSKPAHIGVQLLL